MCPTLCDPWIIPRQVPQSMAFPRQEQWSGGFPGGPVVKNPPSNARDTGSIPGQGSKIPRAIGQISPCCTTREKPPHIIIKKRWREYTEELYKKDLNDTDNHDGVITHLESDILECKVKWPLGCITMNKASEGDGIIVELVQILKDVYVCVCVCVCV